MIPSPPARHPLLLGHRGARRYAPENTLAAFQLALEHACDGFEFDVRLTADGQPIICHGPKLSGLALDRSEFARLCSHAAAKGIALCCLPDVLVQFASRAFLDIELKVPGLETATIAALRQSPPRRGYFVSSFLPETLERLHGLDSTIPLGLICDTRPQLARWPRLSVQGLFLHRKLLSPRVVEELHGEGKLVFVWTVNTARHMRVCASMGVDGIISDDTKLLAQTLCVQL